MNNVILDTLSTEELKNLAIKLKIMCTNIEKERKQCQEQMQKLNDLSRLLNMEE